MRDLRSRTRTTAQVWSTILLLIAIAVGCTTQVAVGGAPDTDEAASSEAVSPTEPQDTSVDETSSPPPAVSTPEAAASSAPIHNDGILTGVIDIAVAGVQETQIDRSLFLSPVMQQRLDELVRPDGLIEPRPEYASLIGGLRRIRDDSFDGNPALVASDVRFFDWANLPTADATLETLTPSYLDIATAIAGEEMSIGPRDGGPDWLIEPRGQTPADRRARGPQSVTVDTDIRMGNAYGFEQLFNSRFRLTHKDAAIAPTPQVIDTLPAWVTAQIAPLAPLVRLDVMEVTGWEASVSPDWIGGEPVDARGTSYVRVQLGDPGASADGTDPAVAQTFKQFGEAFIEESGFEAIFSEESPGSGSYSFRDDANDRTLRFYYSAGLTLAQSYASFEITDSLVQ